MDISASDVGKVVAAFGNYFASPGKQVG